MGAGNRKTGKAITFILENVVDGPGGVKIFSHLHDNMSLHLDARTLCNTIIIIIYLLVMLLLLLML